MLGFLIEGTSDGVCAVFIGHQDIVASSAALKRPN